MKVTNFIHASESLRLSLVGTRLYQKELRHRFVGTLSTITYI